MSSRTSFTMKIILPFAVLAAAGVAAMTMAGLRPTPNTQPQEVPPPTVRAQVIELETLDLLVESQGTVSPRTESRLVPEVAGRIIQVSPNFVVGGFFEPGETLLRIDPHDYERAIVRARADVAAAELRLAQEQAEAAIALAEWAELGVGEADALTRHEPQLENARAALDAAVAELERAESDLMRTNVVAPYAGRVRAKDVDVGQHVGVGNTLGTIYAVDYAEIRLPLPDSELAFLDLPLLYRGESGATGPEVTLRARFAGKMHEWTGRIVRTEGEIDPATRMVHVVAEVADPYGRGGDPHRPPLAAGMFVQASIHGISVDDVAVLPRTALRDDNRVLVIDDEQRLHFREIETLRTARDRVVVAGGLEDGEIVCLSPLEVVVEGMRVLPEDPSREAAQ